MSRLQETPIERCRTLILEMQARRSPVSGGSGEKGRYEMRDSHLYFDLGEALLEASGSGSEEKRTAALIGIMGKLAAEFGENPGLLRVCVRFVEAFHIREAFDEAAALCHQSLGQLREAVEILAADNPLGISEEDLLKFKERLGTAGVTYEEVRTISTDLKVKYRGKDEGSVDYAALQDSFSAAVDKVNLALTGGPSAREDQRQTLGESLDSLRYLLMLMARESIFEESRTRRSVMNIAKASPASKDGDLSLLQKGLSEHIDLSPRARDRLRRFVTPTEMGRLQAMLKALKSEEEYAKYAMIAELQKGLEI
jgi:hypothetical protein